MAVLALTEPFDLEAAVPALGWLAALALLGTALGTRSWNAALRHTSAGTMAAFIFVQPVVGLAAGHGLLGEPVGGVALVGSALVALAVALETRSGRPRSALSAS